VKRRKYRSVAEWRDLIDQQAKSGLNAAVFCAQHGVCAKVFYRRRIELKRKAVDVAAGRFIQVQAKPAQAITLPTGVLLHYQASRLQLPAGIDPDCLAQLMRSLR
jgi:pyrrolidone-carboxylate peptidase